MGEVRSIESAPSAKRARELAEPYVDKQALADHFSRSTRWVERMVSKGMPCKRYGRPLFKVSLCEAWLDEFFRN